MISIRNTIFLMLNIAFGCTVLPASSTEKFDKEKQELQAKLLQEIENFPSIITADHVNTPLGKIPGYKGKPCKPSAFNLPLEKAIKSVYLLRTVPVEFDQIIDHLLALGANPNHHWGKLNLIEMAIKTESYDLVKKLIDHGAKVEKDLFYWKLIRHSTGHVPKNAELIDLLVQHGADIDPSRVNLISNYYDYPNLVKYLIDHACWFSLSHIPISANPAKKSIFKVFDALKTSTPTDPDAKYLVRAYHMFQSRNYEPLRQMLITQPWVLCQLMKKKPIQKDKEDKPIADNAFAIKRMLIACQQAFKPDSIKPLIRFLALETIDPTTMEETDGRTMCERKQIMDMYNVALDASPKVIAPVATSSKIEELEDKE